MIACLKYESSRASRALCFNLNSFLDRNDIDPAPKICLTGAAVVTKLCPASSRRQDTTMLYSRKLEILIQHVIKIAGDAMCLSLYYSKISCNRIIRQVLWPLYAHSYLTYTLTSGTTFHPLSCSNRYSAQSWGPYVYFDCEPSFA